MTEEQLKELARLQEQKALLERLLAQQRHVRTDVCTCWQIEPVYGMGAYSTCMCVVCVLECWGCVWEAVGTVAMAEVSALPVCARVVWLYLLCVVDERIGGEAVFTHGAAPAG